MPEDLNTIVGMDTGYSLIPFLLGALRFSTAGLILLGLYTVRG